MEDKKFKILKVIVEEQYIIEMHDDKITKINGWTISEVISDWFLNSPMGRSHATRDNHLIDNSRKYISSNVVDP
ncbi:MAG: hypothetical protein K9L62_10650 [Vallitaleaceae bacterium]|nr:hypothetical protein [Vallitaleaceae bacterium]